MEAAELYSDNRSNSCWVLEYILHLDNCTKTKKLLRLGCCSAIRQMLSKYDDVDSDLIEGNGPKDNDAKRKFEAFMGLFEHCGRMINDGLLSLETFKSIYEYRIKNMLTNNWIREDKLQDNRKGWCDFLDLCRKLGLDVPAPKRDKPKLNAQVSDDRPFLGIFSAKTLRII